MRRESRARWREIIKARKETRVCSDSYPFCFQRYPQLSWWSESRSCITSVYQMYGSWFLCSLVWRNRRSSLCCLNWSNSHPVWSRRCLIDCWGASIVSVPLFICTALRVVLSVGIRLPRVAWDLVVQRQNVSSCARGICRQRLLSNATYSYRHFTLIEPFQF